MGTISMDSLSMNHYEKQLYSVFKTFDVDDEEALNRSAVVQLCDALQLEDRGAALVDSLFERRTDRVTFTQFRNGLLSVLGGGDSSTVSKDAIGSPTPTASTTVSLTAASTPIAGLSQSDEDSSGREVAPRIVFGSKKYGRRSRPQRSPTVSDECPSPRAASVSRIDTEDKRIRNSQRMKYRRSTSAMDNRERLSSGDNGTTSASFDHNKHINYEQALSLCSELKMNSIDPRLIENIFEESHSKEQITVGEFFDRLNASLSSSIEVAQNDTNLTDHENLDASDDELVGISSDCIISCWERAGMPHPRQLLIELGFTGPRIKGPDLERALEDELRACTDPQDDHLHARTLFLTAALELEKLRLRHVKRRTELTIAERDKLRCDVAEANRRASVLAHDNDETHARMEAELTANMRRAEARLAEVTRQATADRVAERERDAMARARLETELAHRTEYETRLREEVEAQVTRIADLEARAAASEARAVAAERAVARLTEEIAVATVVAEQASRVMENAGADERAQQLAELRTENQHLRDRNDELCCELEARARAVSSTLPTIGPGDLSAELSELLHHAEQECDSSPASLEPRALSYSEAARRLRELLRTGDSLPTWQDKILEISNALMLMEQSNISVEASVQTEKQITSDEQALSSDIHTTSSGGQSENVQKTLKEGQKALSDGTTTRSDGTSAISDGQVPMCDGQCPISVQLREKLTEVQAKHVEEKEKLTNLVKELEMSLEQLKEEYDRCEEYWSGKLSEERELLSEEQRLGDERLAELTAKIGEYERQFARNQSLPTIQEVGLESQVTELEEEFAAYRRLKERELDERDRRIERLAARLPDSMAAERSSWCAALARLAAARRSAARETAALRARAASAEASARRLQQRLAAADLLVKDLYVENCQLAHRRPL
ncbi:ninein homolog isoform X2 [Plodia interpunctella]|uniref:ninein homolog isoform X2 n=1 Tax=Plodia interpunctella TaxID=58824 RepID=UPI002367B6CC|nr:blastoderm-specific protein 25D isoform X2 [Plodia interpunctella]